jgi:toxin ParE1/3/4
MNDALLSIKRSVRARADLLEIWLYIADRDSRAADKVLDEIERVCRLISTHPRMGRERPDILPGIRSFSVMSWTIFYRIEDRFIDIARVIHGARDIDEIEF